MSTDNITAEEDNLIITKPASKSILKKQKVLRRSQNQIKLLDLIGVQKFTNIITCSQIKIMSKMMMF